MSDPARSRRAVVPADAGRPSHQKLDAFLHHLGRTGSVTYAATRTGLRRNMLYKLKASDEEFAARWAELVFVVYHGIENGKRDYKILKDAVAAYQFERYTFQVNLNNITDRLNYSQSFGNRGTPSPGRTVIASVSARF